MAKTAGRNEYAVPLRRVLRGGQLIEPDGAETWLLPLGMMVHEEGGVRRYRLSRARSIEYSGAAMEAARMVARKASRDPQVRDSMAEHEIVDHILRLAAEVKQGQVSFDDFVSQVMSADAYRRAFSMVAVPLRGFDPDDHAVVQLGTDAILGRLGDDLHAATAELAARYDLTFGFTDDVWWTEDYLLNDDEVRDELAAKGDLHLPVVLVVAVRGLGLGAFLRAMALLEAVTGAYGTDLGDGRDPSDVQLLASSDEHDAPPSEDDEEVDPRSVELLVADTQRRRQPSPSIVERPARCGAIAAAGSGVLNAVLDPIGDTGTDTGRGRHVGRRLAGACQQVSTTQPRTNPQALLLHSAIAMECLISQQEKGPGVTSRFIDRLSVLLEAAGVPRAEVDANLKRIYDERSSIVHQGFTATPQQDVLELCERTRRYAHLAIRQLAIWARDHDLWTNDDMFGWLDSSSRA